jgi:hypothetical protein
MSAYVFEHNNVIRKNVRKLVASAIAFSPALVSGKCNKKSDYLSKVGLVPENSSFFYWNISVGDSHTFHCKSGTSTKEGAEQLQLFCDGNTHEMK